MATICPFAMFKKLSTLLIIENPTVPNRSIEPVTSPKIKVSTTPKSPPPLPSLGGHLPSTSTHLGHRHLPRIGTEHLEVLPHGPHRPVTLPSLDGSENLLVTHREVVQHLAEELLRVFGLKGGLVHKILKGIHDGQKDLVAGRPADRLVKGHVDGGELFSASFVRTLLPATIERQQVGHLRILRSDCSETGHHHFKLKPSLGKVVGGNLMEAAVDVKGVRETLYRRSGHEHTSARTGL